MEERKVYSYWLRNVPGLTNKKRKKLVEYCGSAKEVYGLTEKQIGAVWGMTGDDVISIMQSRKTWDLEQEFRNLEQKGISMVTMEEERFPQRLLQLSDCPYALFYKGRLPEEEEKAVAIVGARLCSEYGRAVALEIGENLSACGVNVISGMAAGVDSFGHWGAIRGGGSTYAVLGCGVDVCYPKGASALYERMLEKGGIISEYLPGTPPLPQQFPARNRLISGLSDVLIVVEAKKKSGSLITADFALEQGKEIYAVPGRMDDVLSQGCNQLIGQGAGILVSVDELLLELGLSREMESKKTEKTKNLLEKEELLVYSCFDLHTKNMEELIQMTGMPIPKLADILMRLQEKGVVEEHFKNHYRRKR